MALFFVVVFVTAFTNHEFHRITGDILVVLVAIHLILHWKWIFLASEKFSER